MIKLRILCYLIFIITAVACTSQKKENFINEESNIIDELDYEYDGMVSFESISIKVDSLKTLLPLANETEKIEIFKFLSSSYVWSWPDSAIHYGEQGLKLSENLNLVNEQLHFLSYLSYAYSQLGNFPLGLEKAFEKLELAKKINSKYHIAVATVDIGGIYYHAEDYSKALTYFLKAQKESSLYDSNEILYSTFIGEAYFHLGNLDSALFYIKPAYKLQLKEERHWSNPYLYMGKIDEKLGDYSKALELYKASISKGVPETDYIQAQLSIAQLFKKTNKIDSSIHYAKSAYLASQNTSLYIHSYGASQLLKELYLQGGQIDSAFKYQEIMLYEKDRVFGHEQLSKLQNLAYDEQKKLEKVEQESKEFSDRVILYSLMAAVLIFVIILMILVRNNKFKRKAFQLLEKQKVRVEQTLSELKSTQSQLIQSEKMASLGELTAGIAHEIQNPLNFVNNFSEVNKELLAELKAEIDKGDIEEVKAIADDLEQNEEKIKHHGQRAEGIVKGMLQHSRTSQGEKEPTDINALVDEYLRLAYHGMRAKDKSFNAEFKTEFDETLPKINVVPQDIGRVLQNLINNAFYACTERGQVPEPVDGQRRKEFKSLVIVSTKKLSDKIEIKVKDNGPGIPEQVRDKIFQPFFTTKPTGSGTGLGLSLSYDIVKAHRGELKLETEADKGSKFIILLPVQ